MGVSGPAAVSFRLLGPLEVVADGEPVPLNAAKPRTVLAMLLVHANRVVSADRLTDTIWGDHPPATATNTLQTYVSQLRRVLGRASLQSRPTGYVLLVGPDQLDAARFTQLAAEGRALVDRHPDRAAAILRGALGLWRGAAFAEFADEPFARAEAARLEAARLTALEDRIRADLAAGRHAAVVGELEGLVAADPHREHLAELLMVALYRSGRQVEALRAFQWLRRRLADELGIDPSPALVDLERAVLTQSPDLDLAPGPAGAGALVLSDLDWAPPALFPFVGRRRELALLAAACEVVGREPRVVLVTGDPGMGKSRLVTEAARAASDHGCCVLHGRGDEHMGDAYRLFDRILARVMPGDRPREPDGAAPAGDADGRRLRFFGDVAGALAALPAPRVVLVLDDLHWADVPSLLLLRHLLLDDHGVALTVLAVMGLGPRPVALATTIGELQRRGTTRSVELAGLSPEDVTRLVELGPAGLEPAMAAQLWFETGGNALFVTEVLRDRSGRDGREPTLASLPATVSDVVGRRVRSLSALARAAVEAAAALKTPGDGPLLGRIAALDAEATIAALDEAAEARLLVPVAGDPGTFEFGHRMVCTAVYERIPPARRLDLHRRVALALETEGHGARRPAEVARHWTAAGRFGDASAAIRYLRLAAEAADQRTGYEAAVGHYRSALALMERHPTAVQPVERCQVLLAIAATEDRSGDISAGNEACREAALVAERLGRPDLLALAALGHGGVLATGAEPDPGSARLLRSALAALEPRSRDAALVAARLAELEYWSLPRAARRALCDQALDTARSGGDGTVVARVLVHRFWALNCPDQLEERLAVAAELEELIASVGHEDHRLRTGKCRLHLHLELGDFAAACRLSEVMAATAADHNHREYQRLALAFDAMRAAVTGRFDQAAELSERARSMMDGRGHPDHATLVAFVQSIPVRWLQGRLRELVPQAQMLTLADPGRPRWHALLAWAAAEAGDVSLAREALAALDPAGFVGREPALDWWSILAAGGHAAVILGDAATARIVHDALLPYSGRNLVAGQVAFYGAVSHLLGILAAALGDEAAAAAHLEAALARHEAMGAVPFVALTSAELARLPAVTADRERRAQLTLVAATVADRLGLGLVADRLAPGVEPITTVMT